MIRRDQQDFGRLFKSGAMFLAVMMLALVSGLASCDREPEPAVTDRTREVQLGQRMSELNAQIAQLQRDIAEMRAQNQQQLDQAFQSSREITRQFQELQNELLMQYPGMTGAEPRPAAPASTAQVTVPPVVPTPAPVPVRPEADGGAGPFIFRLILGIIIVVVVILIVRIFMGRWNEEDELDEDDLEAMTAGQAHGDKRYETDLGTVSVSPSAQAAGAGTPPAESEAEQVDRDRTDGLS